MASITMVLKSGEVHLCRLKVRYSDLGEAGVADDARATLHHLTCLVPGEYVLTDEARDSLRGAIPRLLVHRNDPVITLYVAGRQKPPPPSVADASVEDLNHTLDDCRRDLGRSRDERKKIDRRLQKCQMERDRLEDRFKKSRGVEKGLRDEVKRLSLHNARLAKEKERLSAQIDDLKKERDVYRAQCAEMAEAVKKCRDEVKGYRDREQAQRVGKKQSDPDPFG